MSHLNLKMTKFRAGDMVIRDIRERSPGWCSKVGGDGGSVLRVKEVKEGFEGDSLVRLEGIRGVWQSCKFNLVGLENE